MADLLSFLFAQIDKKIEYCVRPDKYRQHQWIFFSDSIHMHALTTILPWIQWSFVRIKFQMVDLSSFLFAPILSVRMNISNTNEYWFSIIYTCIYFILPWILRTYNRVFTRWGLSLFYRNHMTENQIVFTFSNFFVKILS